MMTPTYKVLLCGALALLSTSCGARPASQAEVNTATRSIRYMKDGKTGLCFALVISDTYYAFPVTSIANVPCVPTVDKALDK